MRLAHFIKTHTEDILLAWDEFAATIVPEGAPLNQKELRDHSAQILQTIAADLEQPQTSEQQADKSKGKEAETGGGNTAAETHADERMLSGVAVGAMVTEYRALRASVLSLWMKSGAGGQSDDIQDLMRFNEAIDQAIAESVARYTQQTKTSTDLFIGILGHDIRNPLGTISMSAEYLVRSGQLSAKAAEAIINSVVRINGVIEHVVDFTRAQANGVLPVNRKPGNLQAQFSKVIEASRVQHPRSVLRLDSAGDFDGSWDEGRMGQLLSNLLGNAISHGAREKPVTLRMWSEQEGVAFSVHNSGKPIPKVEQGRIFKPLTRGVDGDKPESREPAGLGLGLYICQQIAQAHGGTIAVESDDTQGTVFTVRLPRQTPSV